MTCGCFATGFCNGARKSESEAESERRKRIVENVDSVLKEGCAALRQYNWQENQDGRTIDADSIDFDLYVLQKSTEIECIVDTIHHIYIPKNELEFGKERYDAVISTLTELLKNDRFGYTVAVKFKHIGGEQKEQAYQYFIRFLDTPSEKTNTDLMPVYDLYLAIIAELTRLSPEFMKRKGTLRHVRQAIQREHLVDFLQKSENKEVLHYQIKLKQLKRLLQSNEK